MPALLKTKFKGRITWLGINTERGETLRSVSLSKAFASFSGFEGESHAGLTRPSCLRVIQQYPRDTNIRNTRQFAICSAEELQQIASNMGVAELDPAWLGSSIIIEGIPDFTLIPPASRLQSSTGATLCVDMENRPCNLPAKVINEALPKQGQKFKTAAKGLRGVTAWVECEGLLRVGDTITLHIPCQPVWPHSIQNI